MGCFVDSSSHIGLVEPWHPFFLMEALEGIYDLLEHLKEFVRNGDLPQEEFDMLTQEASVSVESR